jgi:hypothetical protein
VFSNYAQINWFRADSHAIRSELVIASDINSLAVVCDALEAALIDTSASPSCIERGAGAAKEKIFM